MLGQFTWQMQPHSSLDFPAGDGVFLVVVSQTGGFGGDALKDVVHEGVHDAHGLAGDTSVGVNLLQDFVDVDGVTLLARLSPLLGFARLGLHRGFLLSLLASYLPGHCGSYRGVFVSLTKLKVSVVEAIARKMG